MDPAIIRKLLDIHMGRGASKAALHAHILAYEHLIPDLLSELAAAQAERDRLQAMVPRLEWSERDTGGYKLSLHVGKLSFGILSAEKQQEGWWVVIRLTHWTWLSVDEAAALVADHIASLDLPCTLPAFPGLVQQ